MITCIKCKETKKLDCFYKDKRSKSGYVGTCRQCKKSERDRYYQSNKIKILKKNKEYKKHNSEKVKLIEKKWYQNNKKAVLDKANIYYTENRERIIKRQYEYKKHRITHDIAFKIAERLRTRLWHALKNNHKKGSAVDDLGCTIAELKKYLESQFQPGMSWENYGEWHIDHVRPLALYNLQDHEELKKACHYSNLQPLWAEDNISKGAKF